MTAVDDFLAHYSSKYYDPAKAKAYYLANRELKGRKGSTSGLGSDQRAAVGYAKTQINTARKSESDGLKNSNVKNMATLRANATASRDRISKKLAALTEKLKADLKAVKPMEVIPPPKLNEIPSNASPKQKAFLLEQNAKLTRTHQGKVQTAEKEYRGRVTEASTKARETQAAARKAAGDEMKRVGEGLKSAVAKARADYTAARGQLKTKYDNATDTEVDNIRKNIAGDPPKSKKSTKVK